MPTVELTWNPKQSRFILSMSKRLNLEGGVRAGKSWALCYKVWEWARRYPGIRIALTRWAQDYLDAQLKPEWRAMCQRLGTPLIWHGDEEYDELPNGSMVYLRALHTSDDSKRYSKLAGLTLSIIAIDQAEEVEEDVYKHYVPARLSQPGFPHAVWITPNPPMPDHWIAKRWPDSVTETQEGPVSYELIGTTAYDNVHNLGQEYVDELEAEYPPDSLEYRRLILGKRGLVVSGQPIYSKYFRERRHVGVEAPYVEFDPRCDLFASVDFGTLRPCCVFGQFPEGGARLHLLGGIMGSDIALDAFIPIVQEIQAEWFPSLPANQPLWVCDPAGQIPNSQGSRTAVSILGDFGIYPTVTKDGNDPRVRAAAISDTIGYLRRAWYDGSPVFRLNPRFVIVTDEGRKATPALQQVFEGGYSYDPKRTYSGVQYHGIRPPRKDGYFEHPANCIEYLVTAFAPPDAASLVGVLRNPEAIRKATKLTETTSLTKEEIATAIVGADGRRIIEARIEHEQYLARLKDEKKRYDKDPADKWLRQRREGYFGGGLRGGPGAGGFSRGGYT